MGTAQHGVTIRCPRGGQQLYHHLHEGAQPHLVGRMRLEVEGPQATITLVTTDLDVIRAVLSAHAPNATTMRIDQ